MSMTEKYDRAIEKYERAIDFIGAFRRWFRARSFAEMLQLNIAELTTRSSGAEYDRTVEMLQAMIELNKCDVFTLTGGPGWSHSGVGAEAVDHRAAVVALVDDDTKDWLDGVLDRGAGYEMEIRDIFIPEFAEETGLDGEPAPGVETVRVLRDGVYQYLCPLGRQSTAAELWESYPTRPNVAAQVFSAWQVTIYDKTWGESDLFEVLTELARERQEYNMLFSPDLGDLYVD
jgi:hypothetical protein